MYTSTANEYLIFQVRLHKLGKPTVKYKKKKRIEISPKRLYPSPFMAKLVLVRENPR